MKPELKLKQDNLYWEFNTDTQKVDILWILETEDGKFYQKTKSINVFGGGEDRMPLESPEKPVGAFIPRVGYLTSVNDTKLTRGL